MYLDGNEIKFIDATIADITNCIATLAVTTDTALTTALKAVAPWPPAGKVITNKTTLTTILATKQTVLNLEVAYQGILIVSFTNIQILLKISFIYKHLTYY